MLQRAAAGFAGAEASLEEVLRWGWLATAAAVTVWDFETCVAIAAREVELARDSGALAVLAVGINVFAQAVALGGEFGKASLVIAEADAVVEATGTGVLPYGALVLAGLQGREAEASVLIDATIRDATSAGQGTARPVRALGERDPAQRPRPLRGGSRGGAGCERRRTRSCSSPPGR